MEFKEIIAKRRSIRKYKDIKVEKDLLLKVIEDATFAPSSGNEQPWEFIVVNDKKLIKEISNDAKYSLLNRIKTNPNDYAKKYEKMLNNESFNIFFNAPHLILIIGDKSLKNTNINCTLAASYLMLSAAAQGLGTCWINFATFITSQQLLKKLDISEGHTIVAPITIGYPEIIPEVPKRKTLEIKIID